jgi:hypothetical protein
LDLEAARKERKKKWDEEKEARQSGNEWDTHLMRVTDIQVTLIGTVHNEEWRAKVRGLEVTTQHRPLASDSGKYAWKSTHKKFVTPEEASDYLRKKYNEKLHKGYTVVETTTPCGLFTDVQKQRTFRVQKNAEERARRRAQEKKDFPDEEKDLEDGSSSSSSISETDWLENASAQDTHVGTLVPIKVKAPRFYRSNADIIYHCGEISELLNTEFGEGNYTVYGGMGSTDLNRPHVSIRHKLRPALIKDSLTAEAKGQCTQVYVFRLHMEVQYPFSTDPEQIKSNDLEIQQRHQENPHALSLHAGQETNLQEWWEEEVGTERMESCSRRGGVGGRNLGRHRQDNFIYMTIAGGRTKCLENLINYNLYLI